MAYRPMREAVSGLVVSYDYLWAREFDSGEESGRKSRPACVQILIAAGTDAAPPALLFPITSQAPRVGRMALPIPEIECRRVHLRPPAWIIVDEWNEDELATSPHIASAQPLGSFGAAFVRAIRAAAIEAIRRGRHRRVPRPR